jgi:hypothetical protein
MTTTMLLLLVALLLSSSSTITTTAAFVASTPRPPPAAVLAGRRGRATACGGGGALVVVVVSSGTSLSMVPQESASEDDDDDGDREDSVADNDEDAGASLAAELFKMAGEKGISLDDEDLLEDEEEEEDEEDDDEDEEEEEPNIPQGAINAFLGYDTGDVGERLAGNVTLTDDQLYSEVRERVLDTAGGFVELVGSERDVEELEEEERPKGYRPPERVPDSDLTAGEVVMLVLDALVHNDVPEKNRGVEIFFGFSSEGSQVRNEVGLTPAEYAEFLKETEYRVLFDHLGATIDKGDYGFDGRKAFFTARLKTGPGPLDTVSVNFILSTTGQDDDRCWLVDSMLIRPQSMRRRRRR